MAVNVFNINKMQMQKVENYLGLEVNKNVLLLTAVSLFVGLVAVFFRVQLGNIALVVLFTGLIAAWVWLLKFNWRQMLALFAGPALAIGLGPVFNVWFYASPDVKAYPLWLLVAAPVALLVFVLGNYWLSEKLFAKFPKLAPRELSMKLSAKKMARLQMTNFWNESIFLVLLLVGTTFLGKYGFFILGVMLTMYFVRWFVANSWERLLLLTGLVLSGLAVSLGAQLDMWSFAYVEMFNFPLWVPFAAALTLVGTYRVFLSLKAVTE